MKKEISVLGRIDTGLLPCMPHILLKLLNTELEANNQDRLQSIEHDTALCARILSAWRASQAWENHTPASMGLAIAALGTENVLAIVHNAAIQQAFSPYNNQPTGDLNKHWWHTMLHANLAEQLAREVAYPYPPEARMGAMLCALDSLTEWALAFKQKQTLGTGQPEITQAASDSRQPITASLISEWHLHPFLSDAIRCHQEAHNQLKEAHPLVRIVHLAHRLANFLTGIEPLPSDAGMLLFELERHDLQRLADAALRTTTEIAQRYSIAFEEKAVAPPAPPPGERRTFRNFLAEKQLPLNETSLDAQIKLDLAREVRDLSQISCLRNLLSLSHGFDTTLRQCTEGAHVLFGLSPPLYFVADKAQQWQAYPLPGQDPRVSELKFNAHASQSLAALSLRNNHPLNTLAEHSGSALDRQVSQLLSSSGVLYVPLIAHEAFAALAAFGIESHQLARLEKQRRLLRRFAHACAKALATDGHSKIRDAELMHEKLAAQHLQIKRVVHEVNNPLSIMKNYVKLLTLKLKDDEARNDLRIFNDEIDRIASIIRSLAAPSVSAATAIRPIDINGAIRDLIELSADTLFTPANITVALDLAENLTLISIQRDKLKQILLNLLKNAAEAMPNGGTVTITTRDHVNRDSRTYIEIVISDTGPGLPAEVIAHLFEPVISTKGKEHAGIGLAIVYKLVEEIQASITCISERNGLAFQLLIPRTISSG